MAKTRSIRKRIISVRNIFKITRTMERVAQSKVMKLSSRHALARSFRHEMTRLIPMALGVPLSSPQASLALAGEPLSAARPAGRVFVFCVTSNRGLCGGYNSRVIQATRARMRELDGEGREFQLGVIGKKGLAYFRFYNEPVLLSVSDADEGITFRRVEEIAKEIIDRYLLGDFSAVEVVSTRFKTKVLQEVRRTTLLPFAPAVPAAGTAAEAILPYLVEPSWAEALSGVLPMAVKTELFCMVLEAFLSEHSQRAIAMRAASDNANSMIKRLTLLYNRARQAQITNEMIEIISGSTGEGGGK
jgi:F-type H+-transporting ATPase subunit gamma